MADAFERNVHCLLGLPFDAVDMAEAVRRVRDAALRKQPCFLSTPNLNFVIGCLTDDRFRDTVINSHLSVADGMPLVWIARLLGVPIRERVAGSSLFEALRTDASARLSVYIFGGAEGVAAIACQRLNAESSGLMCAGFETPGFGTVEEMSSDETIAKINASGADFLLVSLAARKGQAWIEYNRSRISVPVISSLGATLNFVAGTVERAPVWMRDVGLEWLWRIKKEPALWRRYFRDGLVLLSLLMTRVLPYAWFLRRHKPDTHQLATAGVEVAEGGENCIVRLRGAWTHSNITALRDCFSRALLAGKDMTLETSEVTYVDSAFVGLVMLLRGYLTRRGGHLLVVSPSQSVRRVFKYCCAEYLHVSDVSA